MTDPTGSGHVHTDPVHTDTTPPPRPPLRRDTDDGLLGGVAAGLARHLDLDVVLVRIGFVVGSILTQGLGVLAYVLCWIFIPQAEEGTQRPRPATSSPPDGRGAPFWVGVGLVTLGALWFLGAMPWPVLFGFGWLDGGVLVPLLLIGLGVALWHSSGRQPAAPPRQHAPAPPPPPTTPPSDSHPAPYPAEAASSPADPAPYPAPYPDDRRPEPGGDRPASTSPYPSAATTEQIMPTPTQTSPASDRFGREYSDPPQTFDDEVAGDQAPPPPPPPSDRDDGEGFVPPPVPTRTRSLLTRATLGLTLVTIGVLWVLEATTTMALGPLRILAIGLAVIGAGLLLGTWVGRSRLLIIPGMLLLPLVIVGMLLRGLPAGELVDMAFVGNATLGDVTHEVVEIDDLEASYTLGAGSFRLDLRALELDEDASTLVEFGAGDVVVIVPTDVNVDVSGSLVAGELMLFGQRHTGVTLDRRMSEAADGADPTDAPTLDLRVNGGFGEVTVRR